MSITNEINRIKGNISSAYAGLSSKGAAMPQSQNSSNLRATIESIPEGINMDTIVFDQVNAKAAAYLAEASYSSQDYSESVISGYAAASTDYRKDRPAGTVIHISSAGILNVYDKAGSESGNVALGDHTIKNLTPNADCAYIVHDQSNSVLQGGFLKPTGALRMIDGGGLTFNIRDLGGWSCDGGTMRYGLIFRGCELSGDNYNVDINADQKRFFRDFLGIRDEIDLRGNSEVDGDDEIYGTADDITESAIGEAIDYIRCPIAPYSAGVDLDNYVQTGYYAMLIKRIASDVSGGKPCYIHCMAGADRTGTLCALIEAICGVSQSDIDKDYELTSFSSGNLRERSSSDWTGFINRINGFAGSSFRDKVVNYALQAGVTIEEINVLRAAMIDGTPSALTSPYADASVTKTLTNVTADHSAVSAAIYQPVEINLKPSKGYVISDIHVTMGGADVTGGVFRGTKCSLMRSVSNVLTNCATDNNKTVVNDTEGYVAAITPDAGYTLEGATVTILMGGNNVSNYYSDGKIVITRVTGNLVITASAVQQAAENLFDVTAITDGARINSSGNAVSYAAGQLVTDYIPMTSADDVELIADKAQNTNGYTGTMAFYDSSKNYLSSVIYNHALGWNWNSAMTEGTMHIDELTHFDISRIAYIRICIAYNSTNNIEIYRV